MIYRMDALRREPCLRWLRPRRMRVTLAVTRQSAVASAVAAYASELELSPQVVAASRHGVLSPTVAVLTFIYAASVEGEMTATVQNWGKHSYGHGAELLIFGATWASVMRAAKPIAKPTARTTASRAAARTTGGSSQPSSSSSDHQGLYWDAKHDTAWRTMLSSCAKATRCALRTVPETPRQPASRPYKDFAAHVAPLAAESLVSLLDSFDGTWSGAHSGLFAHHDSTRIHFSDTGRAFLAQLTLNALPLLLMPRGGANTGAVGGRSTALTPTLPRLTHADRIVLDEVLHGSAPTLTRQ